MKDAEVVELLRILAEESMIVPGRLAVRASRDPSDDKFLTAALEGGTEFVVTGDKDLLVLKAHRGVRIVRPAAFWRVLSRAGG